MPIIPAAGTSSIKGAVVPIAQTRVTNTNINEIGFVNIPQTFTDLYITANLRVDNPSTTWNGFITPYSTAGMPSGSQSTTFLDQTASASISAGRVSNQDGMYSGIIPAAGAAPGTFGLLEGWIFDYASSATRKASIWRYSFQYNQMGGQGIRAGQTRLNSNTTINAISVSTFSGSVFYVPGSIFTLYGIRQVNQ